MAHRACRASGAPPGTHLLPPTAPARLAAPPAPASTARCPPQKPALPSPHSSAGPPQPNLCSELRDAPSGPHCRLRSLSSQHLPLNCQKTVFRGLSLLHMLQARHSLPFFFSARSSQECLCSKEPGRQRKYLPLEQGQARLLATVKVQLPCTLGSQLCDSPAGCSSHVPVRVGTQETGAGQRGPVVAAPAGKQKVLRPRQAVLPL